MGHQKCTGTLSPDQFYISAKALCQQWKHANTTLPNWSWIPCKRMLMDSSPNDGYLSLEGVYYMNSSEDLASSPSLSEEDEEPADSATMIQVLPCNAIHTYDFHVAYNFSYRAPVLYFNGRQSDGQPLNMDDICKDLPEYSKILLRESKWTFITVEDHPYLHRPWHMLHPCGTSDWMKLLLQGSTDASTYLFLWLSVVGQAVGLRIPIDLTNFVDDSI